MVEKGKNLSCIHLRVPSEVQYNKKWAQALQDALHSIPDLICLPL